MACGSPHPPIPGGHMSDARRGKMNGIITCPICGAIKDICIVCGEPFVRRSPRQIVCRKNGKRTCYWKYRYNKITYDRAIADMKARAER
jgi:hypothetical protein